MQEVQKRHRAISFSSFFDWQHLKRFWAARNLTLLEWSQVPSHCLAPGPNIEVVKFKRPRFYSFSDAEIAQMAAKSGHPLPLPSPDGPESRQLVAVESEWKMQAFYDNWQSPQHLGQGAHTAYCFNALLCVHVYILINYDAVYV